MKPELIISVITIVFSAGVSYGVAKASMRIYGRDIEKLQIETVKQAEWNQMLLSINKSIDDIKAQNSAIDAKRESSTIAHQKTLDEIRHFMGRVEEFMSNSRNR